MVALADNLTVGCGELLSKSADAIVAGVHYLPEDPPELIARNKTPYYEALEKADTVFQGEKRVDVGAMEDLVKSLLAVQLASVIDAARADGRIPAES